MGSILSKAFANSLSNNYNKESNSDLKDLFYLYGRGTKEEDFKKLGFKNYMKNEREVFENAKIIVTCVKPDIIYEVIQKTKPVITPDHLFISIAAGISINFMETTFKFQDNLYKEAKLNFTPKITRIMTNHLCSINQGGTVYSTNSQCKKEDEEVVSDLFKSVGIIKKVYEHQMDAFTALTGSSPAFIYSFTEGLVDAAIKNGIDLQTARTFTIQSLLGSSMFMHGEPDKINAMKYIITTPKGTTIDGLNQLAKNRFKYAINSAVTAACKRGAEIEKDKYKFLKRKQKDQLNKLI